MLLNKLIRKIETGFGKCPSETSHSFGFKERPFFLGTPSMHLPRGNLGTLEGFPYIYCEKISHQEMELGKLIEVKNNFASKKVGEEYIVVPIRDNVAEMHTLYNMNEVGSFIWEQLKPGTTFIELQQEIEKAFDVDSETAKKDLTSFLLKLEEVLTP